MLRSARAGVPWFVLVSLVVLAAAYAAPAAAQLEITSEDGQRSLKLGVLVQGRAELLDLASGDDAAQDLYLRRFRLLAGGKMSDRLTYFFETDSPNLGKGMGDGSKNAGDIYIQDFVLTYKVDQAFMLDGGLILVPACYNCNQSAASLLAIDYGPFSFVTSGPLTARVGRDYGLQARGYLGNDHFEYRAGVFQGRRADSSTAPFRYTVRVAWYPFEAPVGLFYPGTTHGAERILSLGASYDAQDDYSTRDVDAFWDEPLANGDALTVQADLMDIDGGDFLPVLPEQRTLLLEAGYYLSALDLTPSVQYASRNFDRAAIPDEDFTELGLAYWFSGHDLNLKLGYGRLGRDGAADRDQWILQLQVFTF